MELGHLHVTAGSRELSRGMKGTEGKRAALPGSRGKQDASHMEADTPKGTHRPSIHWRVPGVCWTGILTAFQFPLEMIGEGTLFGSQGLVVDTQGVV